MTALIEHMGIENPMVSDLTLMRQQQIWSYMRSLSLKAKTISTYSISLRAALNFSAKPQIIVVDDERQEVQLLTERPYIECAESVIAGHLNISLSGHREFVPTFEQLAAWIDAIEDDVQFRFVVIALNTWARNQAIHDLRVTTQVDFEMGLVDLNPPGRRQTNKRRPTIALTDNLRRWLQHWGKEKPVNRTKKYVDTPLNSLGSGIGLPEMTCYCIRHFMASYSRRTSQSVTREQRSQWLGHSLDEGSRTTDRYEKFDPDYLKAVADATDEIIVKLDRLTEKNSLLPPVSRDDQGDNVIDAYEVFRKNRGGERANAKLSNEDVEQIRLRINQNEANTSICEDFGITETAVRKIKAGQTWRTSDES